MTLISVPCAVCAASDFAPVYPGTIERLDEDASIYFSSSRSCAGYLPVVRCRRCGLLQTNPRDDEETLARVYEGLTDHVYDSEDANRDLDARSHLALVRSARTPPSRLLDVGCATGIFVARAEESGFAAVGIDASVWAIDRARARAPRATFEAGTLESVGFERSSFDAITLWDVLEHVDSPRKVLERVRGLLRPGGFIFLSMPNSGSVIARVMGRRWVLLLREHLWYFSPATIARLLSSTGFEMTENRAKWVSFSLANAAGRLGQYSGPVARAAGKFSQKNALRSTSVRFPMGEMDVVARAV